MADEFEVAKSTVCDIWKDQQKIEECIASNEAGIAEITKYFPEYSH